VPKLQALVKAVVACSFHDKAMMKYLLNYIKKLPKDAFVDDGSYTFRATIVTGDQIIARAPDIIIGSWCGKKFRPEKLVNRAGFDALPAVRQGAVHEIKSPLILQPGPAALTDGLAAIEAVIAIAVAAPRQPPII
jgi:ABC-type Fe3+-hydroxamate transport system substrate-binding protein